jgi:uncharacterized protein (DUF433 family)
MPRDYIEQRNGGFYVTGTRVSLDSVIYQFRQGASPETILNSFPALAPLANVYGAIAFILDNQELIEDYLAEQQQKWDALAAIADPPPPEFLRKLAAIRKSAD